MGVFPKQSSHAVPVIYRQLMTSPQSEIIDFYPTDFRLDINGARYAWMGVNLLPFIDRQRLVDAMKRVEAEGTLTEGEKERNRRGNTLIFMQNEMEIEGEEKHGAIL
jgi:5'-3' exoribonuclease 2